MKILLIGVQGSGKSTQGNLLSKVLSIPYLSTGHIFREIAKEKTQFGRYVKEVMNTGALIPDDITLQIVSEYLSRPAYKKGYILDGFPRTLKQAEAFPNGIDKAFYLHISDKEAFWRLSYRATEGEALREDDTLTAIRKRIELFHEATEPVIEYYRQKDILVEINGEQSIEEIHKVIVGSLNGSVVKKRNEKREKMILAFVGMPGAGKTEAVSYVKTKGIPFVRFGDVTDEYLKKEQLEKNPANEQIIREKLRKEFGMGAYAQLSRERIEELMKKHAAIAIDGLYSWEEYVFLKKEFPHLVLIHVYAEPEVRYSRLEDRKVRPLTHEEARIRDIAEVEKLSKGGPIAMADYSIENNDMSLDSLHAKIDLLLIRIGAFLG